MGPTWCSHGNNFGYLEVARHALFREMTHLDVLGAYAGLTLRKSYDWSVSHGTEDTRDFGDWPPAQARALAVAWQKDPEHYAGLPTYRNAENLAAAALEWYVLDRCKQVSALDLKLQGMAVDS